LTNSVNDSYLYTSAFGRQNIGWLFGVYEKDMLNAIHYQPNMILHGNVSELQLGMATITLS